MSAIFLSASVPDDEKGRRYFENADPFLDPIRSERVFNSGFGPSTCCLGGTSGDYSDGLGCL
jgi:hypothetical protein